MQKRLSSIDTLKAIGILGVIATHVFSFNLTNSLNTFIWNYLHFVITIFVFCSGYVMYIAYKDKVDNLSKLPQWYFKRLIRLLQPYYIYLFTHVGLVFLLPTYFSGIGIQKNWKYICQSIILTGGINENWLPLLFIELAVLFPILLLLLKRVRVMFWVYVVLCVLITIFSTLYPFSYSIYRWIMWIPWSLVFVLSWYFVKRNKERNSTKMYLGISLVSIAVFGFLYMWFGNSHRSLTLIDNKYPPNLFYISFEFAVSFFLLALSQIKIFEKKWIDVSITFLSKYSYGLFFIHFLLLDLVITYMHHHPISVWVQLLFVTGVSIGCVAVYDRAKNYLKQ